MKNMIDNIKIIKNIFKNNINDIINDFLANLNWTPYINLNLNLYITYFLSSIYILYSFILILLLYFQLILY